MADANSIPRRMQYRKRPLPSDAELYAEAHRVYEYKDGALTWKFKQRGRRSHGRVGGDDGHGYLMCMLLGHKVKVHQVVWLMHHGEFPKMPLDHIDRDRRNNRIENLRLVSDQQNMWNSHKVANATGVRSHKNRRGFSAVMQMNGRKIYLGYFLRREDAEAAYKRASLVVRGGFVQQGGNSVGAGAVINHQHPNVFVADHAGEGKNV